MINVLYLLKILETSKLSELVQAIELPPLDLNIALWEALDKGEIEINEKKDKIKALKEAEPWHDPVLASKLLRVVQQYAKNESNVTVGRMNSYIKDPGTGKGYSLHEYLMTMQFLIDQGQVEERVVSVPGVKDKRPPNKFVFLCLPEHGDKNEEWNAKAVNKWIATFESNKVK